MNYLTLEISYFLIKLQVAVKELSFETWIGRVKDELQTLLNYKINFIEIFVLLAV